MTPFQLFLSGFVCFLGMACGVTLLGFVILAVLWVVDKRNPSPPLVSREQLQDQLDECDSKLSDMREVNEDLILCVRRLSHFAEHDLTKCSGDSTELCKCGLVELRREVCGMGLPKLDEEISPSQWEDIRKFKVKKEN